MELPADDLRASQLRLLPDQIFDVFVIGGGINGAVAAAALAGHGLKVALAEANDFAAATSQESSNLVWGGFKYLQTYELGLVYKLCTSRDRLIKAYPSTITPVRFLATLDRSAPFPFWLALLGSITYWVIGRFKTKAPSFYRPSKINSLEPVIDTTASKGAIEYSDAYLKDNDSRFVWNMVRAALNQGAVAVNYLRFERGTFDKTQGCWSVEVKDSHSGQTISFKSRAIINAAGPYADELNRNLGIKTKHRILMSRGIHLVVPKLYDDERVLAFYDDTQRLFYVIPMAHRSVIGTTDIRTEDPAEPASQKERQFLLDQINARLNLTKPLSSSDVIAERSGVRPLVVRTGEQTDKDWTALSRKHEIETDLHNRVVTIFGGKLTDCLNVGEEVLAEVKSLGLEPKPQTHWFGEPDVAQRNRFLQRANQLGLDHKPEVEHETSMAELLWRRYYQAGHKVLDQIEQNPATAKPVSVESDVLIAEVEMQRQHEMVLYPEDLLRRRTKLAMIQRPEVLASGYLASIDW